MRFPDQRTWWCDDAFVQAPRICLCIVEDDLRSWVLDELKLITWVVLPEILVTTEVATIDPQTSVVIAGLDRATPHVLEQLRERTWRVPLIAIGKDHGIAADQVLGPKLTSRELKQALRGLLFDTRPPIDHNAGAIG
jgi:hypothetical protein